MTLLRYIARRLLFVIPQLFGIILVSFFMVKLIPGDPAVHDARPDRDAATASRRCARRSASTSRYGSNS